MNASTAFSGWYSVPRSHLAWDVVATGETTEARGLFVFCFSLLPRLRSEAFGEKDEAQDGGQKLVSHHDWALLSGCVNCLASPTPKETCDERPLNADQGRQGWIKAEGPLSGRCTLLFPGSSCLPVGSFSEPPLFPPPMRGISPMAPTSLHFHMPKSPPPPSQWIGQSEEKRKKRKRPQTCVIASGLQPFIIPCQAHNSACELQCPLIQERRQ